MKTITPHYLSILLIVLLSPCLINKSHAQCPVVPSYVTCGELIYNNSFEYSSFPFVAGDQAHCPGELMYSCIWEDAAPSSGQSGTPDLFNLNFSPLINGYCEILNCSIPTSWAGYQAVIPGSLFGNPQQGYAGIFTLDKHTTPTPAYREYLIQHLTTPIAPMETVTVSFQVSLAEISSRFTTISVGFLDGFSGSAIVSQTTTWMDIAPAYKHTFNTTSDKTLWHPLTINWVNNTGTIITDIVIGNFDTDAYIINTYSPAPLTHQTWPAVIEFQDEVDCAYYFIDDVSIQKTQACCNTNKVFINYATGPNDPDIGPNDLEGDNIYMSAIYPLIAPTSIQTIFIQGELIIDGNYNFNQKDVTFGYDSKVRVQAGKTFGVTGTTANPSHLHGCDKMWQGIYVDQPGATVNVYKSIIEDALAGVYVNNGGATGIIWYSKFINNYIGIDYENFNSTNNQLIRASTFQSNFANTLATYGLPSNGYLLPGYNIPGLPPSSEGKRGETGILMNNSSLVIQPTVPVAGANTFYRMQNGVVAYNSNLKVSNATFAQIRNHNGVGGILDNGRAINAINTDLAPTHSLQVDNTTGFVTISYCNNGVWVDGRHTTMINKNKINYTTYRAICHNSVGAISGSTQQLTVVNNKIINAFEGIFYQYCGITTSFTNSNTLKNVYEISRSRGIIYEDKSIGAIALCASVATNLPVQITYNDIKRFGTGIHTSNVSCLNMDNNTVNLLSPGNGQHHGIGLNKSPFNVVTHNIVNGNFQDWRCIGIRVYNSNGVQVGCNTIDKTEIAFFLDNDCDFSRFAMNTITRYNKGFTLFNSAKLGSQVSVGGLDFNLQNVFDKTASSLYEFVADQTVVGNNSVIFFKPGTGAPTDITNIDGALLDNLGNVIITDNTAPGNLNAGFSVSIFNYLRLYNTATFTAGLGYNGCGGAPGDSPIPGKIMEGFTSGYIVNVGFTPFYEPEHTWMFKHNALRDYKLVKDSLNTATLPVSVVNFIDSLFTSNVAELDSVEVLIGMGNYAQAYAMNSICNANCNYSTKLKETNQLLIPQWDSLAANQHYYVTDSMLIQSIVEIGHLCMVEYGDAVLKARIFVHNHIDPFMEFYNPCEHPEGLNPHSQTIIGGVFEVQDYMLYPNPASDQIIVLTKYETEVNYIITDLQGRKIGDGKFEGNTSIDVSQWQDGIYFISLFDAEGSKALRFIISH